MLLRAILTSWVRARRKKRLDAHHFLLLNKLLPIHLTEDKADAICEKMSKGLEENKISGSAQMIVYAVKEAWIAGFEEGRRYPLE